jgi:hypothetical protein
VIEKNEPSTDSDSGSIDGDDGSSHNQHLQIKTKTSMEVKNTSQLTRYYNRLEKNATSLRGEVKENIDSLLSQINRKFDYDRYNQIAEENYFKNYFESNYSNKSSEMVLENENDKFKKAVKSKIESLSSIPEERKLKISKEWKEGCQKFLPFLTSHDNLIKSNVTQNNFSKKSHSPITRISFFNSNYTFPHTDAYYREREKPETHNFIDPKKFKANETRKIFCENYEHRDFMKKYFNK